MELDISRYIRSAAHAAGPAAPSAALTRLPTIFFSVLALCAFTGSMQANTLTATPATIALSCSTATGPGANATIVIKSAAVLTGSNTVAVTLGALPPGVVPITVPATPTFTLTNSLVASPGFTYVFNYAAGCAGATATTTATSFNFKSSANGALAAVDVLIAVTPTVVTSVSALSASPSPVTLTCVRNGVGSYTPGPAKTVTITSAATGGSPVALDSTLSASWLTPSALSSANAAPTSTFTVVAGSLCGSFNSGTTNNTTIAYNSAPSTQIKSLTVSLQVLTPSTLTATPSSISFPYTKGSGTPGHQDVIIGATTGTPFFAVDTSTLPIWLTVDSISGSAPKGIRFSSTSVADTLAPGTYSGTVNVSVSGQGVLAMPVSLQVNNTAPKMTVAEGTTRNIAWNIGAALPAPIVTAVSSDSPISYVVTLGAGTLNPLVAASQLQGLAYSFGTPIAVAFDPLVFAAAQPGSVLTGTVTLKWGNPVSAIVVTFNVTVSSAGAAVTSISPASIPTAAPGQTFTVVLTGSGFVQSTDPTQKTKVGIVVSNAIVPDTNIASVVTNSSNMILTFTVPIITDSYLPFSPTGAGGTVNLGVCNPGGSSTCTIPTGTSILVIGNGPIIQAVTSASSFVQVSPGGTPTIAPYDMLSIFGTNFCSSGGTGCSSTQVIYPVLDANLRYPASGVTLPLIPPNTTPDPRSLIVKFKLHSDGSLIANAPILFATNGQINVLVPSTVTIGAGAADIVVSFGYGTGATLLSSAPYNVNVAATDPGVFTVGSDGQGAGAILNNTDYSLIRPGNEAGMRFVPTDSDTVLIYLTGLGIPDSVGDNTTAGSSTIAAGVDCIAPGGYFAALNSQNSTSFTTDDGMVLQSSLINTGRFVPCLTSSATDLPTVTVGGKNAPVTYAGWVNGSIAGLYQINAQLPGTVAGTFFVDAAGVHHSVITAPVQLPVVVTSNGITSQAGVNLSVAPKLLMAAPSVLTGPAGTLWSVAVGAAVAATEGSGTYNFTVSSGTLPTGLVLNQPTLGAPTLGYISGTPAVAGAQIVTVTATDYAAIPVSGSTTFTLNIGAGLFLSATGAPFAGVHGTVIANLGQITAAGGTAPYTYSMTTLTGVTISPTTGVISCGLTSAAANTSVTVTVTDSTSGTPLTNTITFNINLS